MKRKKLTDKQSLRTACKFYLKEKIGVDGCYAFNGYVQAANQLAKFFGIDIAFDISQKPAAREFLRTHIPKEYFPTGAFYRSRKITGLVSAEKPSLIFAQTDAFLGSYEWRKLRMQAIKKYGRECMCCGATPGHGVMIHVDHIKPRKHHPELALTLENLQILCEVCNHGKGNWDSTDWRPFEELEESCQRHMDSILQH